MKIQNVQYISGLLQSAEGKANHGRGTVSAESDQSLPMVNLPEAHEDDTSFAASKNPKSKGDLLQIIYPPFFPIGNTQGIYSVLAEPKPESELPEPVQPDNENSGAGAIDISERQVASVLEGGSSMAENAPSVAEQKGAPGSVLDLTA